MKRIRNPDTDATIDLGTIYQLAFFEINIKNWLDSYDDKLKKNAYYFYPDLYAKKWMQKNIYQ